MMKKSFLLLAGVVLLSGCQATLTNLTPQIQVRNTNNLYQVEVAMVSRQQTLRWDSVNAQVVVGKDAYPLRSVRLMTNRWEGLLPVPADKHTVTYHYKLDYKYNTFGPAQPDSATSRDFTLKIVDQ
jgi:hypothetical protein